MAIDPRVLKIVDDLIERSEPSRPDAVKWDAGRREDQFIYSSSGASVLVSTADGDGLAPYVLSITNGLGETIVDINAQSAEVPQQKLGQLWMLASRNARRVDETLDSLLRDLEGF